jgi:calcineurin-like phosphoesterase family protein
MSNTWFVADTHFGHANIIKHSGRPFDSVEEMDACLIENWNAVVRPGDVVWHLGDFAHRADEKRMQAIFGKLNGSKHLLWGNHDDAKTARLGWASISELKSITVDGQRLVLCHYAMRTWDRAHRGALQLFGHSHAKLPGWRQSCDVGVDAWAYFPTQLQDIKNALDLLPTEIPAVGLDHLGPDEDDPAFHL